MIFHKRVPAKTSKTLATPSRCFIERATVSDALVEALSIPPEIIKRVDVDNYIGEGRFGTCSRVLLNGMVACAKFISSLASLTSKPAIIHEAMMLSKVHHPNIAFLLGIQITKEPFQVLTLLYSIQGTTVWLYDIFKNVQKKVTRSIIESVRLALTLKVWLVVMKNLGEALDFIHHKGIVHRDLKSDNVVLSDQDGTLRSVLIDFGKSNYATKISRYCLTEAEKEQYRKNHKHIAPDLVDGVSDVTPASDMYSHGRLWKNVINYFPLSLDGIEDSLQVGIKKCLKYDFSERPSASNIVELLTTISGRM